MISLLRPPELVSWEPIYETWNFHRIDLIHMLKKQSDETCNQRPEDGSWSPCEVADHLRVTQSLYANLLALVNAGKKGERLDGINIDYDSIESSYSPGKLKNPEIVNPAEQIVKSELIQSLNKAMDKTEKNLLKLSMDDLRAIYFEHPMFGNLSMLDWLWALTLHEEMHIDVLKKKLIHQGADLSKKLFVESTDGNAGSFH
ncbi:MAG: DinB family protein [Spirochaetia bacterium]|nr:DinB family protein [Spirochaetia bacterium]